MSDILGIFKDSFKKVRERWQLRKASVKHTTKTQLHTTKNKKWLNKAKYTWQIFTLLLEKNAIIFAPSEEGAHYLGVNY